MSRCALVVREWRESHRLDDTGLEPVHLLHLLQGAFGHSEPIFALTAAHHVAVLVDDEDVLDLDVLDRCDRSLADGNRLVVNEDDVQGGQGGRSESILDRFVVTVFCRGVEDGPFAAIRGESLADADVRRQVRRRRERAGLRGGVGEGEGDCEEQEHGEGTPKRGESVTAPCYHLFGFISNIPA